MGCDIHVFVERWKDNAWEPVYSLLQRCSECEGTTRVNERCKNCESELQDHDEVTGRCFVGPLVVEPTDDPCTYCTDNWAPPGREEAYDDRFYRGRNYNLFALLANVRGESPDPEFTQADRGVPIDDCSKSYLNAVDAYGDDGHSHTWYLLSELLEHNFYDEFPDFHRTIQRLMRIDPNPANVRVLMFFDN